MWAMDGGLSVVQNMCIQLKRVQLLHCQTDSSLTRHDEETAEIEQ